MPFAFRGLPPLDHLTFVNDTSEGYDAIASFDRNYLHLVEKIIAEDRRYLTPVACFHDAAPEWADIRMPAEGTSSVAAQLAQLAALAERVNALPPEVRTTRDPAMVLLARMHTRQRPLAATFTPGTPAMVSYPVAGLVAAADEIARRLADLGYLSATFFDRLHVCPACRSSRLNVREECLSCRSSNIGDRPIVHHFKCAYEGPESAFRRADRLICPKCGDKLEHLGLDYDKPGSVVYCHACGKSDDHSAVGFVCTDCGTVRAAEEMPTRDWYSYEVTALGEQALRNGSLLSDDGAGPSQIDSFRALVRQAMREEEYFRTPFSMLRIGIAGEEVIRLRNERLWVAIRSHSMEVLRGVKRDVDVLHAHGHDILLLMPRCSTEGAQRFIEAARVRLGDTLIDGVDIVFDRLDAEQTAALLGDGP